MDTTDWVIFSVVFIIGLIFSFSVFFILFVAIPRWIFRIDEIVNLLKQIAKPYERDRRLSDLKRCAVCEKEYPTIELIEIDSGQLLCSECHKIFEKKRQVKL
jgi:hypothetical protein